MTRATEHSSARADTGFTLLDVLLTIAILAILTGGAASALRGDDLAIDRIARELVADAVLAQQLAIETGQPLGLRFDVTQNSCMFVLADGRTPRQAETTLRGLTTLVPRDVERLLEARSSGDPALAGGTLTTADFGGSPILLFDTDGSARSSGAADLRLNAESLRLRVQTTGRIVITQP